MSTMVKAQPFTLPPGPYVETALEPFISGRTMSFHYEKHHKGYVDKLNKLVTGTEYADNKLVDVIKDTFKKKDTDAAAGKIFNNAAQVWNHTFFWRCMKPKGEKPEGEVARLIERDFKSHEGFVTQFGEAAEGQFGSGYIWLVLAAGKLVLEKKPNAVNPLAEGKTALFTVDIWEHAYYLDYQNRRKDFVEALLMNIVNWDFVNENLDRARAV